MRNNESWYFQYKQLYFDQKKPYKDSWTWEFTFILFNMGKEYGGLRSWGTMKVGLGVLTMDKIIDFSSI
jgi:hypothetical protein